jgi:hypothetical protein
MTIIKDAKEIAVLTKKIDDIELHQKIVNLPSSILELSHKNIERSR